MRKVTQEGVILGVEVLPRRIVLVSRGDNGPSQDSSDGPTSDHARRKWHMILDSDF